MINLGLIMYMWATLNSDNILAILFSQVQACLIHHVGLHDYMYHPVL